MEIPAEWQLLINIELIRNLLVAANIINMCLKRRTMFPITRCEFLYSIRRYSDDHKHQLDRLVGSSFIQPPCGLHSVLYLG